MESDVLWGEDKENFLKTINYHRLNNFLCFKKMLEAITIETVDDLQ